MGDLRRTALYLRLSRDDEKTGESLSIENQRAILRQYVSDHGGTIAGEYVDDGWSGTNFERPGIGRLLEDAKAGKIDTILVKDLSRFGRNYIQVGQYIDYIFPACGIRFIALSDNVDTADRSGAGMDLMPIMNVFNEWHAANTSKKIRAVLESDWRRGKYTGWAYPYGYRAGNDEHRTAVIDDEAAKTVRRIFDFRLQGMSVRAIARLLTEEGIPCPAAHYTRKDGVKSSRQSALCWSPKTVSDILRNETYLGTLTQHRTTHVSYKNHKVLQVPHEERIVRENAHPPLISREVWEGVQTIRAGAARGRTDGADNLHALSGLMYCADCGKKLKGKRTGGGGAYLYVCRTYADLGKRYCTSHAIGEKQIEGIVLQEIRSMLGALQIDAQKAAVHYLSERAKRGEQSINAKEQALRSLRKRVTELGKLLQSAYEDRVSGILSESTFKGICGPWQSERDAAERKIDEIERELQETHDVSEETARYLSLLARYARCEELTREMCLDLIAFITVGEKPTDNAPRPIHIYYKFTAGPCLDDRETVCAQKKGLEGHERARESMETHGRE